MVAPPPASLQSLGSRIAALVLDLPQKRNAMSGMMVAALSDCVSQLQAQATSRECHGVLLRSNVPGKLRPGAGPAELVQSATLQAKQSYVWWFSS